MDHNTSDMTSHQCSIVTTSTLYRIQDITCFINHMLTRLPMTLNNISVQNSNMEVCCIFWDSGSVVVSWMTTDRSLKVSSNDMVQQISDVGHELFRASDCTEWKITHSVISVPVGTTFWSYVICEIQQGVV